jgi:hypothetical protein
MIDLLYEDHKGGALEGTAHIAGQHEPVGRTWYDITLGGWAWTCEPPAAVTPNAGAPDEPFDRF